MHVSENYELLMPKKSVIWLCILWCVVCVLCTRCSGKSNLTVLWPDKLSTRISYFSPDYLSHKLSWPHICLMIWMTVERKWKLNNASVKPIYHLLYKDNTLFNGEA